MLNKHENLLESFEPDTSNWVEVEKCLETNFQERERQNDPEQVSEAPKRANKKKGEKVSFNSTSVVTGALVFIDVILVQTWEKIDF